MKNLEFNIVLKDIVNKYANTKNLQFWANLINIDKSNLSRYINGISKSMDILKIEKIESYLNSKNDSIKNYLIDSNNKHLFHGSREGIKGEISINYNSPKNDFGKGFYLGESLFQSCLFVSGNHNHVIYEFDIDLSNLKGLKLNGVDWVLFIAYNRGYLTNETLKKKYNKIKDKYDYIVGPIADDRTAIYMNEFFSNHLDLSTLLDALTKVKLGNQYCLISENAVKNIKLVETYHISKYFDTYLTNFAIEYKNIAIKELEKRHVNVENAIFYKDLIDA